MDRLRPDTAVEEANLTQNVFEVRKALGEVPGEQRFIATVPRRGYRFVADVHTRGDTSVRTQRIGWRQHASRWSRARASAAKDSPVCAGTVASVMLDATWYVASRGLPWPSSSSAVRKLTRLTFGPGLQTDVSWSPDGRGGLRLGPRWQLRSLDQSVDGGEPTRLTSAPADESQPAWSPDGHRLVFRSESDGGGVFTVDVSGGPVRRIAPFGRRPAWMPNGRDVVLVDNDSPTAAFIVSGDGGEAPARSSHRA